MKKAFAIILACVMLFALAGTAFADVLWEPYGGDMTFYEAHREEMQYVNRQYYANDKSGYLELFAEPEGESLGFLPNSYILFVGYTFDYKGETWGLGNYCTDAEGKPASMDYDLDYANAYFKMSGTAVVYDSKQFIEDNGPFATADADFSKDYGKKYLFWTYPGSGELFSGEEGFEIGEGFTINYLYTDPEGNEWGHVDYYMAMRDCWICVNDPMNKDLPVHAAALPDFYPTPTEQPAEDNGGFDNWTLVIIIVCVVVAIAIALILTLGKKKKPEDAEK